MPLTCTLTRFPWAPRKLTKTRMWLASTGLVSSKLPCRKQHFLTTFVEDSEPWKVGEKMINLGSGFTKSKKSTINHRLKISAVEKNLHSEITTLILVSSSVPPSSFLTHYGNGKVAKRKPQQCHTTDQSCFGAGRSNHGSAAPEHFVRALSM